jgi:lipid-A-disaccharide synthase
MQKEVVKELIQDSFTKKNLKRELGHILNGQFRATQLEAYDELIQKLGGTGASQMAATLIIKNTKA